jgi:predicted site-specific integrase-resolvase
MKKVVIFARESTNIQDYERQVNELTAVAKIHIYL